MKVLIIYNKIWSYREKIFTLLNQEYDLTVGFSDPKFINTPYKFKTKYLPVKKAGPFEIHSNNLHKIASEYDVVIGIASIRWFSLIRLAFKSKRSYKLGYWGIGVTASYENKFDSHSTWDKLRFLIAKKSDFTIFYSSYPVKRYVEARIPIQKLFVANNTAEVQFDGDIEKALKTKKNFLFIGTLYKQKGIDELLDAYYKLIVQNKNIPDLLIIGDGPERDSIQSFINSKGISDKVKLYGSIFDPNQISAIFNEAMVCISPNQAGLSVLTSMGNATCFVTRKDATTGGEIFNIENKINGIIYNKEDNLVKVLQWIIDNPKEIETMNKNAYDFYTKNRTPQMMAGVISKAIKSSINKK